MKPEIQTYTGRVVDFQDPWKSNFTLEDIAHGLSMTCRYAGQCDFFYSVAQHAVLVSYLTDDKNALAGLHHDDTEAFMGDVTSPLKTLLQDYRVIEGLLHDAIFDRLRLPRKLTDEVKDADLIALALEKPILIGASAITWNLPEVEHPSWDDFRAYIKPMSQKEAKKLWLDRHEYLCKNQKHSIHHSMY